MSLESTPRVVLEAKISTLNARLGSIAQKAIAANLRPFDLAAAVDLLGPSQYGDFSHPQGADFLGFWNECLCTDSIYAAAALSQSLIPGFKNSEAITGITSSQRKAAMWLKTWLGDPKRIEQMTDLQGESCASYREALYSFAWHEDPDLLREFSDTAADLSRSHRRLE